MDRVVQLTAFSLEHDSNVLHLAASGLAEVAGVRVVDAVGAADRRRVHRVAVAQTSFRALASSDVAVQ